MRLRFLLVIVMALAISSKQSVAQSNSQEPAGSTDAVTQCEEEIKQKTIPSQVQYAKELEMLAKTYQAKGQLENVIAVKNEQDRFMNAGRIETANIVPSPEGLRNLQTKYKALMEQIEQQTAKRYLTSLEQQKKTLTVEGKLDEALAVKKDIEEIQQRYSMQSSGLGSGGSGEGGWTDITRTLVGGTNQPSGIVLTAGQRLTSRDSYAVPIEIEYVCKTDSTNIRLAYACDQLIFNWERDPDELRIDGGPVGGQHRAGAGRIPPNQFITIRQVVHRHRMEVFVDDKLRANWVGDFSKIESPISIFSPHAVRGVTLTIKSLRVQKL